MELSKSKASLISSLSSKKMRRKNGMFVVEGEKCVNDMLESFQPEFVVTLSKLGDKYSEKLHNKNVEIFFAPETTLKKISSLSTPTDILAVFRLPMNDIIEVDNQKLYLLLDGVQDPGNLGTIIRTADWFGIDTVFSSHSTVDVFNPKTVQATMGSLSRVKVCYTDLEELIDNYPEMPTYGTFLDGKNIYATMIENRGFLVMGNEGNGISEKLQSKIKDHLLIPPYHSESHGESLNVAVATAIALSRFRFG